MGREAKDLKSEIREAIAMKSMYCVYLLALSMISFGCADVIDEGLDSSTSTKASSIDALPKFKHADLLKRQGISSDELMSMRRVVDRKEARPVGIDDASTSSAATVDSVDLIIAFPEDTDDISADKMMRRYKMFRRYDFSSAFRGVAVTMHVDDFADNLVRMQDDPSISWFEPDLALGIVQVGLNPQALLPLQEIPWGITDVGGEESSTRSGNMGGRVQDVNFYILDSGSGIYDNNVGLRLENYSSSLLATDLYGHGAHVTGTAVGSDNLLGFVGIAPGAKTYSFKVLDDFGSGTMASVISALDRVAEIQEISPHPGVVNLSLGAYIGTTEYTALDHAIDNLVDLGIVVVVAAGNDSTNAALVTPAHAEKAITVGAYDANHEFASFSNFGSVIDINAPGVDILSVGSLDPVVSGAIMSGTSMAAPHVAGAALLYLSNNPTASPARVRKSIISDARPIVTGVKKRTTSNALWVGEF